MRDDHRVPVAGGNPAEQPCAFARLEVFLAGNENVRGRIQREQFRRELREHVIGHDEHRFRRQPEPLQLDSGCDHRVGLAGADDVREQRVIALDDSPDGILLMRVQRDLLAARWQRQMAAIEDAQADGIELVIILSAKPLASFIVFPNPRFEALFDFL